MTTTEAAVLEVLGALARRGIGVSVAGGWAVDALLRRATREHRDLDLAIDTSALEPAIDALSEIGLRVSLDERPSRVELRDDERIVDLHPVVWGGDGTGRQAGLAGETYEYPPGSTDARGVIGGRDVRCLTPELLIRFHDGYEPRPVDRRDMAALAARFGLPLPHAYADDGPLDD